MTFGTRILRNFHFKNTALLIAIFFITTFAFSHQSKADWRKNIGVFRVGIITTDQTTAGLDRLAPFKLALSEALNIEVEFFRARNTVTLIDALASERIEYAIISSSGYALAWTTCQCVEPVAIPRSKDSTDGYHTVLITSANGPKSLKQLAGTNIGILNKNSITGHVLATQKLSQRGVFIGDDKTPFITKETPQEMLKAFSSGEVQAMVGWSSMTGNPSTGYSRGNLKQLVDLYGVDAKTLSVLWKSDQIPHRPHIIRKKINGEAKQILRNTLLAMYKNDPVAYDSIEPVYGGGFTVGRHDRFLQIIDLIQAQNEQTKTAEEKLPLQ